MPGNSRRIAPREARGRRTAWGARQVERACRGGCRTGPGQEPGLRVGSDVMHGFEPGGAGDARMDDVTPLDSLDAGELQRVCARYGVRRLRVFGSVLTDCFDPERSDVDFLVDFEPGRPDPFDDYFGLRESLEAIVGRDVDLIVARAVRNPYFRAEAWEQAQDLYAA